MDVVKMLDELKRERQAIEEAIVTLERLAKGQVRRRGRPPSWMKQLEKKQAVELPAPAAAAAKRGRKAAEAAS